MVQNDLMTIKKKIRQLELGSGSGSTVGSDASTAVGKGPSGTFARPGIGIRLNDFFIPRKIDFKGWVTQTTNNAVTNGSRQIPKECWLRTRQEQGTWPTKLIDSMWFKKKTNLPTMVGMLHVIKKGTQEGALQVAWTRSLFETGDEPEKEALGEGPCFVLQRPQRGERDESQIHVVHGKNQMSFFVGSAMAAKYTPEGEGHARNGWTVKSEGIARICTEFSEALFEAVVHAS